MKIRSPLPAHKARLEIIPLIDVMFFLLAAFMMVSLTMSKQATIKVNLPVASTAIPDIKPDVIHIAVNAAGDLFFETKPVSLPELEAQITERRREKGDIPVSVSGDAATPHGQMVKAFDVVRRLGFTKVAIQVKPATPAP